MLEPAQREAVQKCDRIFAAITDVIALLRRQSESIYDGKSWAVVSLPHLGNTLITQGKALIRLGELFNTGGLPAWKIAQDKALEESAYGRLGKKNGA